MPPSRPGNRPFVLLPFVFVMATLTAACEGPPSDGAVPGTSGEAAPNEVTVMGLDYAFEAPDTLPPGPTLFGLDNQGVVRHEVCFGRLVEGLSMEEALEREAQGETVIDQEAGCLFADEESMAPSQILLDLEPGRRYGMICNIRDTPNAPPHTELGMYDSFVVE